MFDSIQRHLILLVLYTAWACSSPSRIISPPPDTGTDAGPADAGPICGDITTDPTNCGACGHACGAKDLCVSGVCVANVDCLVIGCPTKSWCDATTGLCRQGCSVDASCGGGRLCDLTTHTCVPAPDNCFLTPCPAGHTCDSNHACMAGCGSDSDCPLGNTCAGGTCQSAAPACRSGTCPGGLYCDASTKKCLSGCDEGAPCPDGAACDLATHTCGSRPSEETCLTAACAPGLWCDRETGRCKTGCDSTAACSGGKYCDTLTHQCLTTPVTCPEAGCPYGSYCSAVHCQPGCMTAADCGYDWTCNANHQCVPVAPGCSVTGCAQGKHCDRRTLVCVPDCTRNSDCGSGQTCDTEEGRCRDALPTCPQTMCPTGTTCDPGDGLCKQNCGAESCTCDASTQTCIPQCSPANCNGGRYCDATFTCVAGCSDPLYPCGSSKVCNNATHTCVTPTNACTASCEPGTWCNATTGGRCLPGCDANQPCANGQSCDVATHSCYQRDTCSDAMTACDGTCVDLMTSSANCGTCRNPCPASTPTCQNGHCYDPCPAQNKTNCDGVCTITTNDDQNCGACGRVCPASAFVCQNSQCVDPCPAQNKTDCNGACVDTTADGQNCGGCGHICPASAFACLDNQCVDPCPAQNKTDCGGACVDTETSTQNCGTCGTACPSEAAFCVHGQCTACPRRCAGVCIGPDEQCIETLWPQALGSFALSDGRLYWAQGSYYILSVGTEGGAVTTLASNQSVQNGPVVGGSWLHWETRDVGGGINYFYMLPKTGGTPYRGNGWSFSSSGGPYVSGLDADAEDYYFSVARPDSSRGDVHYYGFYPSDSGWDPFELKVRDNVLYFREVARSGGAVRFRRITNAHGADGTNDILANAGQIGKGNIAVDSTNLYSASVDYVGGRALLGRVPLTPAGGYTPLISYSIDTSVGTTVDVATDGTSVYFSDRTKGTILKVPVGGGTPVTVVSNLRQPFRIAVDETSLYWSSSDGLQKLTPR